MVLPEAGIIHGIAIGPGITTTILIVVAVESLLKIPALTSSQVSRLHLTLPVMGTVEIRAVLQQPLIIPVIFHHQEITVITHDTITLTRMADPMPVHLEILSGECSAVPMVVVAEAVMIPDPTITAITTVATIHQPVHTLHLHPAVRLHQAVVAEAVAAAEVEAGLFANSRSLPDIKLFTGGNLI